MTRKILIAGGAGYLGSTMVGTMLARGHSVTVLDNLMYGQTSLMGYLGDPRFRFVRGDVRDERALSACLKEADAIIWLAAIVGAPACDRDPLLAQTVNFDSVKLMNRLRSRDQIVIYPCTNSGYGTQSGEVHCTEETPLEPISLYGRTKVDSERELLASENAVSLRLATVFGPSPRMRYDLLLNDFVYRAVTDRFLVLYEKDFKRNFIHVGDVADVFAHVLDHFETMKGTAYNAGLDAANISKAELADKIGEQVKGLYVHYAAVGTDPDKRNYIVSNAKLARAGFTAQRSLESGIRQVIQAVEMRPRPITSNI